MHASRQLQGETTVRALQLNGEPRHTLVRHSIHVRLAEMKAEVFAAVSRNRVFVALHSSDRLTA